jgi:putative restriction endonuclease
MIDDDLKIRLAAFEWLNNETPLRDDVLSRTVLQNGFLFQGQRIPLMGPPGIFKPHLLRYPISITTTMNSPYDDTIDEEGVIIYRYRGDDPKHRDNIGLREAFQLKLPLIYFHGLVPGKYSAVWPIFIIGDDPDSLSVRIAADEFSQVDRLHGYPFQGSESASGRRAYITSTVKIRLHQRSFRERVLNAYSSRCSLCRLRHRELLDAAHIIPDEHPKGEPIISNGISLCKLHHAAFDKYIIGITPDYEIRVRQDVLDEEDGPILQHGLKELDKNRIFVPRHMEHQPNRDHLDWRYKNFLNVA